MWNPVVEQTNRPKIEGQVNSLIAWGAYLTFCNSKSLRTEALDC